MDAQQQTRDASYTAALDYLFSRINYERTPGPPRGRGLNLDRMRDLLRRIGNPEDELRAIHIAGTKGKGSIAAMISSVLSHAGYRTGLYTSPHLDRLEERISLDGENCSPLKISTGSVGISRRFSARKIRTRRGFDAISLL